LVLCVLIDELLVVGDEGLGDGLTDGVDLGSVSTTGDADADVDAGELVEADDQERLVQLCAECMSENVFQNPQHPSISFCCWDRGEFTLKRRISGWIRLSGFPLTLTRPFPAYNEAIVSITIPTNTNRAPPISAF
jgi:hypothetical protein